MKPTHRARVFIAVLMELVIVLLPELCRGETIALLTVNAQNLKSEDSRIPQEVLIKKIGALAQTVRAAGSAAQAPDIIFLQEVRDRRALELFKDELGESAADHKIYFYPPEGGEPFSVATLSRLPLAAASRVELVGSGELTRRVLHLKFKLSPSGELDTYNVHLPSAKNSIEKRLALLGEFSERLVSSRDFLIAGDFNLTPPEFLSFLKNCGACTGWVLPQYEGDLRSPGTFFDRMGNKWNIFDTMILGDAFRPRVSSPDPMQLDVGSVRIVTEGERQLEKSGLPRRFDYRNAAGVSDHLPLRIDLVSREEVRAAVSILDRFPELPALQGNTLLEYASEEVFPVFHLLNSQAVYVEKAPSLRFFQELTEERRRDLFSVLKEGNVTSAYETHLKTLEGSLLQVNLPVFNIIPGPENPEVMMLSSVAQTKLAHAVLFELGYGAMIDPGLSPELRILLIPTSSHNLRAYTYQGEGTLQDLTYQQLCPKLDRVSEPVSLPWLSLLTGEHSAPMRGDALLGDVAGIFIAEEFKRAALGMKEEENPWMSGKSISHLVLLHDYFQAGGRIPRDAAEERADSSRLCPQRRKIKETISGSCGYYQERYGATRCERIRLETILSTYYEANYDSSRLRVLLECRERNLFQCLDKFISNPSADKKSVTEEFGGFLSRLAEDAGKIELFLKTVEVPYGIMSDGCYV